MRGRIVAVHFRINFEGENRINCIKLATKEKLRKNCANREIAC